MLAQHFFQRICACDKIWSLVEAFHHKTTHLWSTNTPISNNLNTKLRLPNPHKRELRLRSQDQSCKRIIPFHRLSPRQWELKLKSHDHFYKCTIPFRRFNPHQRAQAKISRPLLQTRHSYSPAQFSPTRAEADVSTPLVQTHHLFSPTMSTPNVARRSDNSIVAPNFKPIYPGENQDQTNSSNSSHTRSEADTESYLAQSALPETPDSVPDAEDLEARFEKIIKAVQGAGFESIDDMSAQYYTATFKEDTLSHWSQSRSRSRSLHSFLASLHASTDNWSHREIQGYRQQTMEAAESFYVSEILDARKGIMQNGDRWSHPLGENACSPVSRTMMSVQSLWQTIAELELSQDFKQKKTMLREKVCFSMTTLI